MIDVRFCCFWRNYRTRWHCSHRFCWDCNSVVHGAVAQGLCWTKALQEDDRRGGVRHNLLRAGKRRCNSGELLRRPVSAIRRYCGHRVGSPCAICRWYAEVGVPRDEGANAKDVARRAHEGDEDGAMIRACQGATVGHCVYEGVPCRLHVDLGFELVMLRRRWWHALDLRQRRAWRPTGARPRARAPRLVRGRREDAAAVTVQQVEVEVDRAVQTSGTAAVVCRGGKVSVIVLSLRSVVAAATAQDIGQRVRGDGKQAVNVVVTCVVGAGGVGVVVVSVDVVSIVAVGGGIV